MAVQGWTALVRTRYGSRMVEARKLSGARRAIVVGVIPVRMSSRRLPGKALRTVRGIPVISHVVERLRRARQLDGLWIATSREADDDVIADWANANKVSVYRGGIDDVAGRILATARRAGADAVVRISGDSPLIDPAIVDAAVAIYRRERPDIVTNVFPRTFPKGQSVEVIATHAIARAHPRMSEAADREHVTTWFYADTSRARIESLSWPRPCPDMQLSVDTAEDLARVEAILMRLGGDGSSYALDVVVAAAQAIEAETV